MSSEIAGTNEAATNGTETTTRPRRSFLNRFREWLPALSVFIGLIVAWQLIDTLFDVPAYILPSPAEILREMREEYASLMRHLGWTMLEAVLGFLLGSALAFLAAVLFVHVRTLERSLYPWAIVLQTVPIVAIAPLLTIWLGFGVAPKMTIAAIVCFFPMLVNSIRGLRSVSPQALELMRILSASGWDVFSRLRLPSSLPYVFSGLKVASTLSVIGAIVAEFTGADRGIGYVVQSASYRLDTRLLFAGITFSSLAGILFFAFISTLEKMLLRWPGARIEEE
jgi:NitT/TauT family transport system permease protein